MARALVITNPAASRTRARTVAAIMAAFRMGGWQADALETCGTGDARRLAGQGVVAGVDVVAVFGGDGTTMQAAAALVGTDTALGVIPGGTGNLLAGNLRIPMSPVRATQAIVRGHERRIDLGRMQRGAETQYFAVACGAGYDARVMAATGTAQKRRWKFAAYVATTIRLLDQLRPAHHVITVDGQTHETDAAMLIVANCAEVIPPLVRFKSGIRPDDGMLDLIAVRASNFSESVRAVWHLVSEAPTRGRDEFVAYGRGAEITVVSTPAEPVQLDGEPHGETPFTASVVPGALKVMIGNGRRSRFGHETRDASHASRVPGPEST
ncbi:MAG TPA: diacylglycerol kinase family protein [Gemmatimonadales bacterium]|nr:diacylglycerol kinase family protein [Gemmatimonadales bacterium]